MSLTMKLILNMDGFSFHKGQSQGNQATLKKSTTIESIHFVNERQTGKFQQVKQTGSKKPEMGPNGSKIELGSVFKQDNEKQTIQTCSKPPQRRQSHSFKGVSSTVGFFKNMFKSPKESESIHALKLLRLDYSTKINLAFLAYLILSLVSDGVILHRVQEMGYQGANLMIVIIVVKSILIMLHMILTAMTRSNGPIKKLLHQYNYYWLFFLTGVFNHLTGCLLKRSTPHSDILLLSEYQNQNLYILMSLFIMIPIAFLIYIPHLYWYFASYLLAPFPLYLITNDKLNHLALQLRGTAVFALMPCLFTLIMHSKAMNIIEIITMEVNRAGSYECETQQLLEKMPEGVLIVDCTQQKQMCFMNEELGQVLNVIQDMKHCGYPPESIMSREEYGLMHKIFKQYKHEDAPNGSVGGPSPNKKDDLNPEFISLQEMIEDNSWQEEEERFFEINLIQDQTDENGDGKNQQTIYTQIRRLIINYNLQPAIMIVIRNISVIIEFEKVKNENKYQELLTATMSHEMLTPLNSIINLAIYIEQKLFQRFIKEQDIPGMEGSRGGSTSDKVDVKQSLNYLHIIKSSANILQYLVKDLIDLMNIRLDRFVQFTQMFSPTNACNEVLQYFEIQSKEKGLFLRRTINPEARAKIHRIFGDKNRYQQILLNIVANSVKFTYEGGIDVALDFTSQSGGRIQSHVFNKDQHLQGNHNRRQSNAKGEDKIQGCNDCGSVVTSVTDTGIGMEKSMVDRLFKIFGTVNRGEQSSLITTQGIGLGLTICKQLVEKLGGQIHLTSIPNQGTKVIFNLPIKCISCVKQTASGNAMNNMQSMNFNQLKSQMDSNHRHADYSQAADYAFKSYSNCHNGGTSMMRNYASNNQRLMSKPQTPTSRSIMPPLSARKPFGGDISITSAVGCGNKEQNNSDINAQMRSSAGTEYMPRGREPPYDQKSIFGTRDPTSQSQTIYRSTMKKMDSMQNHLQQNPIVSNAASQKSRNDGGGTQSMNTSYRRRQGRLMEETSKSKSKGAQFTDSRGGNLVLASDFISSSQGAFSINDKMMKKSFATKVMIENTIQFGILQKGTMNYDPARKFNSPDYLSQNIENGIREQEEESLENKSVQLRQQLQESSKLSINDEVQDMQDLISPKQSYRPILSNVPIERMLHQLQSNQLHANDLFSVTQRNRRQTYCPQDEEEEDKHSSQCEERPPKNKPQTITSQYENVPMMVSTEHIQMPPVMQYSRNEIEMQEQREKNLTGYFPVIMQSKFGADMKQVKAKKEMPKYSLAQDKEIVISPGDIDLEIKQNVETVPLDNQTNNTGSRIYSVTLIPKNGQQTQQQSSSDMTPNFKPQKIAFGGALGSGENEIQQSCVRSVGPGGDFNMKNQTNVFSKQYSEPGAATSLIRDNCQGNVLSLNEPKIRPVKPPHFGTVENGNNLQTLGQLLMVAQNGNIQQSGSTFTKMQQDVANQRKSVNSFNRELQGQETHQLGQMILPLFLNTQEKSSKEAPRTPNLPQINEVIDNIDSDKRKTGKDNEGPDLQVESIARINLESAINDIMDNISNTGPIPRGNLNVPLKNSQKKECGCESTVLIVDDNFFNLVPLELILRETYQLQVDKAQNGLEAVNKFRLDLNKKCCNIRYRMVFMDLNMPVMDGYRATEIILQMHAQFLQQLCEGGRRASLHPNTPPAAGSGESSQTIAIKALAAQNHRLTVVAVTAFVNDESIRRCYEVGMQEVIHKPVSSDVIRDILEQYYYNQFGLLNVDADEDEDDDHYQHEEQEDHGYKTQVIPPPCENHKFVDEDEDQH